MNPNLIFNPQLEGEPFFWEGGPTGVLLIHGYTATTAEVRPLARFLHEHGYTVAGPLLPGHFTRPEDANRHTWHDWVRVAEEAYRKLTARCTRVVVGGESTGALLALYLASEHPEVLAVLTYAPALRLKMNAAMIAAIRVLAPFVPYIRKTRDGRGSVLAGLHGLSAERRPRAAAVPARGTRSVGAGEPAAPDRAGPPRSHRSRQRAGNDSA